MPVVSNNIIEKLIAIILQPKIMSNDVLKKVLVDSLMETQLDDSTKIFMDS